MNRNKHYFWLLSFILFSLKVTGTNTLHTFPSAQFDESVYFHPSSATANVGDIVAINIKVGAFTNVENLSMTVSWDKSYLSFQSVSNINLPGASLANFNVGNGPNGNISLNLLSNPGISVADSTIIFTVNLKVISYSGNPVKVSIPFITVTKSIGQVQAIPSQGFINIINNNSCNGKAASLTCANAPLLCAGDFPYCNLLPTTNKFTNFPSSCGGIENAHFFNFDAASTSIRFKVSAKNCTGGPGPFTGNGVQLRVFKTNDCTTFTRISCELSVASGQTDVVDVTGLVVGERYLLMLDGVTNDVCDYIIDIVSGGIGGTPNVASSNITGVNTSCKNQTGLDFSIPTRSDAISYIWRIAGNSATITAGNNTNAIKVNWGTVADSVCIKVVGSCGESQWACKYIDLSPPSSRTLDTTICKGSSLVIGGLSFNTAGSFPVTIANGSFTGCDSLVNLNLTVIDITASASKSSDLSCAVPSVTLTGSTVVAPTAATLMYEWKNPSGTVIGTNPSVFVNQAGTYTFKVKAVYNGVSCEKEATVSVTRSGVVPSRPELRGDVATCENRAVTYNIVNPAGGISQYNWFIEGGSLNANTGLNVTSTWGTTVSGKICVNAQNGCGVSDTTCLSVEIGKKPSILTPTGSQNVCPASDATYQVPVSANVKTYQWTVPTGATIVSGQNTNSINVNWGTSTGGNVCLIPSNDCGSAQQSCLSVVVANTPPDSIPLTGPRTVCPGAVDTIKATPDAAVKKYLWKAPANVTIVSGQGTPSVIVRFDTGTEAVVVLEIENSCLLKKQESHTVAIKSLLPDVLPIVGTTNVCSNDTSTFGVSGNASIIKYQWSVPTGATIISGQNSQTIRVAWGTATTGQICLELTNACNLTRNICTDITIKNAIVDDFTINGATAVCPNSTATYSIAANPKFKNFKWTVPANGTITSGQGTNSVNITWNANGNGDVCLEVANDCNIKRSKCLTVEVKAGIDSLTITGSKEVCENATGDYTVQKDPDAISYLWRLPAGAVKVAGGNTNSITVRFGSTGGLVTVTPVGGCAVNSSSFFVSIKKAPDAPATVTGAFNVCQGETQKYKASPVPNITSYKWQAPVGAVIVGSDSTDEVTVRWQGSTGGRLVVKTKNECYTSLDKTYDVFVNKLPQPKAGADDSTCARQYVLKGIPSVGTLVWRTLETPAGASLSFVDSTKQNAAITVSKSGRYVLLMQEKNGQCTASDTVVIYFREAPQLTLASDICGADGAQYTFKATINGIAPFTVSNGLAGTISNNIFTSNPINEATSYALIIKDAFGCESNELSGVKQCPCTTKSAVLKNTPLVACYGQKAKVEVNSSAVLDANDTFEFILHDGSANTIGTILLKNQTGEFDFDVSKMQYDRLYHVAYRAGNNTNGAVNTSDRCYTFSSGVPLIFKSKITASLKGDTAICANTNAVLTFKTNSTDLINFTFLNVKENITANISNARNNTISTVSPSTSTSYKLLSVADRNGCLAEIVDSALVNIRPRLTGNAGADQVICIKDSKLAATVPPQYKGTWRSLSGADIANINDLKSAVSNLKNGKNTFILTAQDSICSAYRSFDSISIFLPLIPKALNLSLEMFAGDTIKKEVTEQAPQGTYSVTRITNPDFGRFDIFSNGAFNYIADPNFTGIAKFRFMICSEQCTSVCDTGEVRILIKRKPVVIPVINLDVPNAITPNGDGKNDVLTIDNIEKFPEGELTIFNRWGDVLFRAKPYRNDWDGTNSKGQPLPEGTYYYILRLDLNNSKVLRGDMTILR